MSEGLPDWVDKVPESATEQFFVGVSMRRNSVQEARDDARNNAFKQVVEYYGTAIQARSAERSLSVSNDASVVASLIHTKSELSLFAQAVVSQISADNYYTEAYQAADGKRVYVVHVLCQVSKQQVRQEINDLPRKVSAQYSLNDVYDSLCADLIACSKVVERLGTNPLHREIAYRETPKSRVGLYGYVNNRIDALAGSIRIDAPRSVTAYKGDTLKITVRVTSTLYTDIGVVKMLVRIHGMNNIVPDVTYTLASDNTLDLQINTAKFAPGAYNVSIELLLKDKDLCPSVRANPSAGFSFDIKPASAFIETLGATSQEERRLFETKLNEALIQNGVSLAITDDEKTRYRFVITVEESETRNVGRDSEYLTRKMGLDFLVDGVSAGLSARFSATGQTERRLLANSADSIASQTKFFKSIGEL
jgi:hypothetical protein